MKDAERAFAALRAGWLQVDGLRWSKLVGLFVAPFPAFMFAPWENAAKIQGSRPKPIAPDRAPVKLTPAGPVLERADKLPVVLPTEEPVDADWPAVFDTPDAVAW